MAINVTTSKQQITASVAEDKISANVSAGFGATGPQGPSGVIDVTAPITNSGTTTAANVGLSVGTGLSVSGGALVLGTHTHDDRYYTETEVNSLLSGYATLVGGKVPAANLPSYVDDVVEVASYGALPASGETGKIYLVTGTNQVYRWTGFVYVEIVASPGSTDAVPEGSVNLYHTNVRAAAAAPVQSVAGKTGSVVLAAGDIASGTLSASRLPIAAAGTLGAVRIGSGISIDGDGIISASAGYTLPTATNSVLGGVKIGSGVTITDGVISVSTNYAAASHTHAISDVTDLATTLAGKADASDFDQGVKTTDSPEFEAVTAGTITVRGSGSGNTLLIETGAGVQFQGVSAGSILSWDAYGSVVALPSGSSGQVLVSSSSAYAWGTLTPSDVGAAAQSHQHGAADVTSGTFDIARIPTGTSSTTVCIGNDARLSDARTPTAHNHSASEITSGVIATARLASSGTASASTYLRGDQTWSSLPAGGSTNVWIPASAFIPRTTNGCGVDSRETATNRTNWDELLFDAGADEFAQAAIVMPSNYNAGTFTARFYWTASGATDGSDDVIWGIQARAFANDDALDTAFGTAQTVTDTVIATNDMHVSSATSAVTPGGTPAANVPLLIQIYRDADAAGDTYGHDARLLGVEIIYTAA